MKRMLVQMGVDPEEETLFHGARDAYQSILDHGFDLEYANER